MAVCPGHRRMSREGSLVQVTSSWWRTETRTARDLTVSQGTILWSRSIMLTKAVLRMTVSLACQENSYILYFCSGLSSDVMRKKVNKVYEFYESFCNST